VGIFALFRSIKIWRKYVPKESFLEPFITNSVKGLLCDSVAQMCLIRIVDSGRMKFFSKQARPDEFVKKSPKI
jgi:hypothetical protein